MISGDFKRHTKDIFSVLILFVFTAFLLFNAVTSIKTVTIKEYGPPLSSELLFTTKWEPPKSTDTSVTYTEFATRVMNKGQISYLEVYYVLSEDSTLVCHIMDEDLNIIATSDYLDTEAGVGYQTFTVPDYEYDEDNLYIALESDKQSIGLGTVQELACVAPCVTADNRVDGIQNAQRWSMEESLTKHNGSTQYGITLYIKAFGPADDESGTTPEDDITETPEKLFTTKWQYPTATATNTVYSGLATRVSNRGNITSADIYYVLTEDSMLTASILDTDLNYIVSSDAVATSAGIGLQHFEFPDYDYNYDELYIALESNRQSIGVGSAQDNAYIGAPITGDNSVPGHENACSYSPTSPLKKKPGSTKGGLSLYIVAYGIPNTDSYESAPESVDEPEVEASEEAVESTEDTASFEIKEEKDTTKSNYSIFDRFRSWGFGSAPETTRSKSSTVYISTSGSDSTSSGSESSPYKTLKYAIKQNGDNTTYLLKCGDYFSTRYGINITSLQNVTISSYGSGPKPCISGLIPFTARSSGDMCYGTISETDMGVLVVDGYDFWSRRTKDANITEEDSYYLNPTNGALTLLYNGPASNCGFAAPYCGMVISSSRNLTIDNIELCYYGIHGIQVTYNSSDIAIQNCEIHHIGGSMSDGLKFGNGIELWLEDLNDIDVIGNDVHDCFDAGITGQIRGGDGYSNTDIVFSDNVVTNCRYNFEYFNSSGANTTCQMTVSDNVLNDCVDLTNGYRERAGTSHGAFLCLWNSNGNNDSVICENNVCEGSDASCVSYKKDSNGKIYLKGNTFSDYEKDFWNGQYYYGSNNNF